ncbi:hypothetical protein K491DRAFT_679387 [Lophiostoma macrostomum CBS 122681]|uniref:Uncharacterized protein n=1 Tax=Lophiostoma macrostomum CBS 122681 TaxID=1314788 RepID=A0A6A6T4K0_9PLEO|nr:hypothetical protein K491DRAFT_679387 [Lophiostoma macrostomum CBS 122681]
MSLLFSLLEAPCCLLCYITSDKRKRRTDPRKHGQLEPPHAMEPLHSVGRIYMEGQTEVHVSPRSDEVMCEADETHETDNSLHRNGLEDRLGLLNQNELLEQSDEQQQEHDAMTDAGVSVPCRDTQYSAGLEEVTNTEINAAER